MKAIYIVIITLFIWVMPITNNNQTRINQNCSAELTVKKNRSFKSADADGADFELTLTNTSNSQTSYELKSLKLSTPCSNKVKNNNQNKNSLRKSTVKNSDLNISLRMNNYSKLSRKSNNIITLNAGQSKTFFINATAVEGTPYNTWGCIKVEATSIDCKSIDASIILSVYIPDPTEN